MRVLTDDDQVGLMNKIYQSIDFLLVMDDGGRVVE